MMLEKHCISLVIPILSVEHFYVPEHRHIYQAITELFESGSPVELLTVSAKLRDAHDTLDETVDDAYGYMGRDDDASVARMYAKVTGTALPGEPK